MSEAAFAKSFLSALDGRPNKYSPDHVEDPKNYPARTPYILPRMPKPMPKPATGSSTAAAPGSERSMTVVVRPLAKTAALSDAVRLSSQPLSTTSLLDVKAAVSAKCGVPPERLRILHKKKPVADSKVLRDVVGDAEKEAGSVEFAVMVMGAGAPVAVKKEEGREEKPNTAVGASGRAVVESEEFWDDLRGFLLQRVKEENTVDELFSMFLRAWENKD